VPLKILIAPDKFKGTLTAKKAADAIARGWCKVRAKDALQLLPITDGGDGFGAVMSELLKAKRQTVLTVDAAHRPRKASWWWEPKTKTALIEAADVIGLALLPPGRFHPFELDTFGIGAVLRAASAKEAKRCLIGIGGSATNDGGFGVARALGWTFLDRTSDTIERWTELHRLAQIVPPKQQLKFEAIVAVDVQNPLLGICGATRVYGPQKGLKPSEFKAAERSLQQLASIIPKGRALAKQPGSGAAGGLGFGLLAHSDAKLEPGFELFSRLADLNRRLHAADLVITGEGCLDASTCMGKGVGEIAHLCQTRETPCLALAGTIEESINRESFSDCCALTHLTTAKEAKAKPAYWLQRAAEEMAQRFTLTAKA
jgi:glycerate 2-kinase